jgi:SAM-dependent methyltransferase
MSETAKYRHLTAKYCQGSGVDIGTGGYEPVVPHAICVELPPKEFAHYTGGRAPAFPIHLGCGALDLPFKDQSLSWAFASHLLEDFYDWLPPLTEWCRVVKIGGFVVIIVPDKRLWNLALSKGQPPNCQHRHESRVGELSEYFRKYWGHFDIVEDRLTGLPADPKTGIEDYSILFVAKRVR